MPLVEKKQKRIGPTVVLKQGVIISQGLMTLFLGGKNALSKISSSLNS